MKRKNYTVKTLYRKYGLDEKKDFQPSNVLETRLFAGNIWNEKSYLSKKDATNEMKYNVIRGGTISIQM